MSGLLRQLLRLQESACLLPCFQAWLDKHNQTLSLQEQALRLQQQIDDRNPLLTLAVYETLLSISGNDSADVFLDTEISNLRFGTQATITRYHLRLERNGKEYKGKIAANDVSAYQVFNVYEVEENGQLVEEYANHESLVDLAAGKIGRAHV